MLQCYKASSFFSKQIFWNWTPPSLNQTVCSVSTGQIECRKKGCIVLQKEMVISSISREQKTSPPAFFRRATSKGESRQTICMGGVIILESVALQGRATPQCAAAWIPQKQHYACGYWRKALLQWMRGAFFCLSVKPQTSQFTRPADSRLETFTWRCSAHIAAFSLHSFVDVCWVWLEKWNYLWRF